MSNNTTLSEPTEFYTLLSVLGRGYEVRIMINNHQFVMQQNSNTVIVTVDGEQRRFIGCTEQEMRAEMDAWTPGAWKG